MRGTWIACWRPNSSACTLMITRVTMARLAAKRSSGFSARRALLATSIAISPSSSSVKEAAALFPLFAWRFIGTRLVCGLHDKVLHPLCFFLKSGGEIVSAVFEKDDKTEGEEYEKNEPEQPA